MYYKICDTLQGTTPTNFKKSSQTYVFYIERNFYRLGMLSPPAISETERINSLQTLPVRRSLLAPAAIKQAVAKNQLPPKKLSACAFKPRAKRSSTLPTSLRSTCHLPLPNLVLTRPFKRATVRLRVLRHFTSFSDTEPPASRVPPPPEEHQIGARKKRTGWTPSSHNPPTSVSGQTGGIA